ncbi:hypothetical protein BH20ACT8_BH20ACT8_09710 [soil metagenome]
MRKSRGDVLREEVLARYELSPAEARILEEAAVTVDELGRLEHELADAPLVVPGSRGQMRANPLLAEVRAHRRVLDALLRSLSLPVEGETVGRPRSPRHAAAARERWRRHGREAG